jgi:Protein of unknown function (DUF2971)
MKAYKYRVDEPKEIFDRDVNTLIENQFYAPNFDSLNDPFDSNFRESITETIRSLSKTNSSEIKSTLDEVLNYKTRAGIYSLSKSCKSEQMWAYYANSNKGYCIEYDLEKLEDKSQNRDFIKIIEVEYSDETPTLSLDDLDFESIVTKMFGTKKEKWIQEQEIRLIFDNYSKKHFHPSAITGVYFGYQTSQKLIDEFYEKLANRDIDFYKITPILEDNRLRIDLINSFSRKLEFDLKKFNFTLLKQQNYTHVINYYIHINDILHEEELREFVLAFREKTCYKQNNIYIFNSSEVMHLLDKHQLNNEETIKYAESLVFLEDSNIENFTVDLFPLKDIRYKELKAQIR